MNEEWALGSDQIQACPLASIQQLEVYFGTARVGALGREDIVGNTLHHLGKRGIRFCNGLGTIGFCAKVGPLSEDAEARVDAFGQNVPDFLSHFCGMIENQRASTFSLTKS